MRLKNSFNNRGRRNLRILSKGRGTQTEVIDLGDGTVEAIAFEQSHQSVAFIEGFPK
jgi:hypothetical protein